MNVVVDVVMVMVVVVVVVVVVEVEVELVVGIYVPSESYREPKSEKY